MKKYEQLSEELKLEAKRWHPKNYIKWSYNIQNKNIIFCILEEV